MTQQISEAKGAEMFDNQTPLSPALHLVGLGPLLAVTPNAATGFAYGVAWLFVLLGSGALVRLLPLAKDSSLWLPAIAVCVATVAGVVEIFVQTYAFAMTKNLGIFVPLLASQSLIYLVVSEQAKGAEVLDRDQTPLTSLPFLRTAGVYLAALILVGFAREFISTGSILNDVNLLFNQLESTSIILLGDTWRFKLMELAPGAFILLGFLVAMLKRFEGRST